MEIKRNVILDLLPMYLANEVSLETRDLIENYLKTDQELARFAQKQKEGFKFPADIPMPLTEEDQINAYKKSRIQLALIIMVAVLFLAGILGIALLAFFTPS